jgi:hypothetical protein
VLLLPNTGTLFYLTTLIIVTGTLSSQQTRHCSPLFQFTVSWGLGFLFQLYEVHFMHLCIIYKKKVLEMFSFRSHTANRHVVHYTSKFCKLSRVTGND